MSKHQTPTTTTLARYAAETRARTPDAPAILEKAAILWERAGRPDLAAALR